MTDTITAIISIIASLGIGGIAGAFIQSYLQQQRYVRTREHNFKQKRYLAILILMLTQLDSVTGLEKIKQFRNDLNNLEDVKKEIQTEFLNSFVFASDDVIQSFSEFIKYPNRVSFFKVTIAMRRDLWGKSTKVTENILDVFEINPIKSDSILNKDINKFEDTTSTNLLKNMADGNLYGGLFAILGIAIAAFYAGWLGMSVVMLVFGLVIYMLESKQLQNILGVTAVNKRVPWRGIVLSSGIFLFAIGVMGLIDNFGNQIPQPIRDGNWKAESIIGICLIVVGIIWTKFRQK